MDQISNSKITESQQRLLDKHLLSYSPEMTFYPYNNKSKPPAKQIVSKVSSCWPRNTQANNSVQCGSSQKSESMLARIQSKLSNRIQKIELTKPKSNNIKTKWNNNREWRNLEYHSKDGNNCITQYKSRNFSKNHKDILAKNISDLTEDINYSDALFVPPLKIKLQLRRLIKFNSKLDTDSNYPRKLNKISSLKVIANRK